MKEGKQLTKKAGQFGELTNLLMGTHSLRDFKNKVINTFKNDESINKEIGDMTDSDWKELYSLAKSNI